MQTQLQTIEPAVIDPEAVAAFYQRRPGTEALAQLSVRLAQEVFAGVESITLQAVRDPEEDAEWIRVCVTARMDSDDLQAAYYRYVDRWVSETPPDLRYFVRLWHCGV